MSAETRIIGLPDREKHESDHPIYGLTPTQIDAYNIVRLVGQGSMGSVYEVQHNELGRHFALKLMAGTLAGNHEAIERFRAETRALGKLDHPNIVQAIDAGQWQGRLYLVTELLSGLDLASQVAQHGRMSFSAVVPIASQLCNALSSAHAHGFYHRDIKPSNIFLLQNGGVKLLDFGLVRTDSAASMTRAGSFMGTVDFVAPEQAGNPTIARACSDIYSLGCTLIYLLSGQPPFEDQHYPSIAAKIHAHLHNYPKWFDQQQPAEYQWFVDLLRSMVAKNPDDRPQNCQALADCIDRSSHESASEASGKRRSSDSSACTEKQSVFKSTSGLAAKSAWAIASLAATATGLSLWWNHGNQANELEPIQAQSIESQDSTQLTSLEKPIAEDGHADASSSGTSQATVAANNSLSTSTLPVSRTQSARGVPQLTKQLGDKKPTDKLRPTVLTNKYE